MKKFWSHRQYNIFSVSETLSKLYFYGIYVRCIYVYIHKYTHKLFIKYSKKEDTTVSSQKHDRGIFAYTSYLLFRTEKAGECL